MQSGHVSQVTRILKDLRNGDCSAPQRLWQAVYDEFRKLAAGYLGRERKSHTLQPTALVNEAYLKLVDQERAAWGDEMHFFDAIQSLREAIRLHPKKSFHKLLAHSLMKNPLWAKEAEEQFRLALQLDQFDAECLFSLGQIYEDRGMTTRAQKMYEQAATYDPENEEIQAKVGDKKSEASGGLSGLRNIFGRKKG